LRASIATSCFTVESNPNSPHAIDTDPAGDVAGEANEYGRQKCAEEPQE
jgi:hypothetical protein